MSSLPDVNLRSHPDGGALFIAYVLDGAAMLPPLIWLAIPGVIISHIKVKEAENDAIRTHHRWLIRSFWWTFLWMAIGAPLYIVGIGWFIHLAAWIWWVYRVVYGLLHFYENKPMPV